MDNPKGNPKSSIQKHKNLRVYTPTAELINGDKTIKLMSGSTVYTHVEDIISHRIRREQPGTQSDHKFHRVKR